MNKIVILNGPPSSGKDVIAQSMGHFMDRAFKDPMFELVFQLTGLSHKEWFTRYDDRDLKEEPWDKIGGMSCRELMIFISEKVMKRIHGQNIFGELLARKIKPGVDYVFSDGGFMSEIQTLTNLTKDTHQVYLIRIYRDGYTFEGDSRDYVKGVDGAIEYGIRNFEGCLPETVETIKRLVRRPI